MSKPISPELVLFPDFSVSNIPRYFSFADIDSTNLACKFTHMVSKMTTITSFQNDYILKYSAVYSTNILHKYESET